MKHFTTMQVLQCLIKFWEVRKVKSRISKIEDKIKGITGSRVDKENIEDDYGDGEAKLPRPVKSQGHQYEVIFEDLDYNLLTATQKNKLFDSIKLFMVYKNKVGKQGVWITLQRGSLKICGDLQDSPNSATLPAKSELRAFIRDVERPVEPPGINQDSQQGKAMAERVQDTLGPFGEFDPWMAGRQEDAEARRGDTEEGNEDSKGG